MLKGGHQAAALELGGQNSAWRRGPRRVPLVPVFLPAPRWISWLLSPLCLFFLCLFFQAQESPTLGCRRPLRATFLFQVPFPYDSSSSFPRAPHRGALHEGLQLRRGTGGDHRDQNCFQLSCLPRTKSTKSFKR